MIQNRSTGMGDFVKQVYEIHFQLRIILDNERLSPENTMVYLHVPGPVDS